MANQNQMVIQLIDNEPGVSDQERIVDPFVTTKNNGEGIGLAVSRSIVEAHGGRVWAEDSASGGAAFGVALHLFLALRRICPEKARQNYGPLIVSHRSKHASGSHPCRVFPVSYEQMLGCHGTARWYGREEKSIGGNRKEPDDHWYAGA